MKFGFIDTETTGVNPDVHGLVQLAMILEEDDTILSEREWKIRPFPEDEISDKALEIHGFTREQLQDFPPPEEVFNEIVTELNGFVDRYNKQDKALFIGYNGGFDYNFTRRFFEKNGNQFFGSYFIYPAFDVAQAVAMYDFQRWLNMAPNRKLATVAGAMLTKEELKTFQAHDALSDIRVTRLLWKKCAWRTCGAKA